MVTVLQKLLVTVVLTAVLLIPLWIFLAVRGALHPEGFWQNLATGALGVALLGGMQIFLLILLVWLLVLLWTSRGRVW